MLPTFSQKDENLEKQRKNSVFVFIVSCWIADSG